MSSGDLESSEALSTPLTIRLYVAGSSPNSAKALANLNEIIGQYTAGDCQLEIIDVLTNPRRALADGVLVTPSLIKSSPPPVVTIVGDLRHKADVLQQLNLSHLLR